MLRAGVRVLEIPIHRGRFRVEWILRSAYSDGTGKLSAAGLGKARPLVLKRTQAFLAALIVYLGSTGNEKHFFAPADSGR